MEEKAASALKRRRWKEACECYKALNKRFPGRYDSQLAESYTGRFEEFLSRSMYEPAGQILAQLRDLVPEEAVFPLALRLTRGRGLTDDASSALWSRLQNGGAAALQHELVDALVMIDGSPPDELRDHPEVVAVLAAREGLAAVCRGDAASLGEALSRIPRRSALRHWNLILRALDAWYRGDDGRVSATLERLNEATGAVAQLAAALDCLSNPLADAPAETTELALVLGGLGRQAGALLRVDELAREGALNAAFTHARKHLPGFMVGFRGAGAAVGEYFLEAFQNWEGSWDDFGDFAGRGLMDDKFSLEICRNLIRVAYRAAEIENEWEVILELHLRYFWILSRDGAEPALAARLFVETVRRLLDLLGPGVKDPDARDDADLCLEMLRQARQLDPECAAAGLLLAEFHARVGQTSELNRLLDELAVSFPENVKILILAGRQCVERGTYKRGLAHLRKAVDLDPLDRTAKRALVDASLRWAFKDFGKKKADRGRERLAAVEALLSAPAGAPDFYLERRWMRLWSLALEEVHGDAAGQEQAAASARAEWAENPLAMDVFLDFYRRATAPGRIRGSLFSSRFQELEEGLSTADLLLIMERAGSAERDPPPTPGWPQSWVVEARRFVAKRLRRVVPERLDEALAVLWASFDRDSPAFFPPGEVLRQVRAWSRLDRSHPQLKLLHLSVELSVPPYVAVPSHRRELEKAIEEARRRGDEVALRHAQRLRLKLEEYGRSSPFLNLVPDLEVEEFDDDLDDDDDDDEPLFKIPPGIDPERIVDQFVDKIYPLWRDSSPSERLVLEEEIRAELGTERGQSVRKRLLDRLTAENARSSQRKQKAPRHDPPSGEASPPAPPFSQTELF